MINVSFNELAIVNELSAPRNASRLADVSAFSTMLDEVDSRQDAPTNNDTRENGAEPRAMPAAERTGPETARPDGREAKPISTDENTPKPTSPTAKSDHDDAAAGVETAATKTDTTQTVNETDTAGTVSTVDKPATENSQVANYAAVAPVIQTPAKLADVQPDFAPTKTIAPVAPQAASPAPLPQGDSVLDPVAQTGSSASMPVTPNTLPGAPQSNAGERPAAAAPGVADTAMATLPALASGKVMSETLFAVTSLSQAAPPELDVLPPSPPAAQVVAAAQSQTGVPVVPPNDVAMATPAVTKLSQIFPQFEATARDANAPPPSLLNQPSSSTGPSIISNPTQQVKDLADLFATEGIKLTLAPADNSISTKPVPALANGMVAQIGAVMPAEGQAKSGNTSGPSMIGLADSAAAPNASFAQTAMAVAATPMVQAAGHEPQPKFTATADGLMVNTFGSTAGSHATYAAAAEAVSTGKVPVASPPVLDQVVVNIAKAVAEGIDKINIKLKPATLGQIEVQLEIASDGRIHAVIAADKPETLDLLQRDARALERALGEAGLRTDSGSLSFNLRGQGEQNGGSGHSFANFSGVPEPAINDSMILGDANRIGAYLNSRAIVGGVDIRV